MLRLCDWAGQFRNRMIRGTRHHRQGQIQGAFEVAAIGHITARVQSFGSSVSPPGPGAWCFGPSPTRTEGRARPGAHRARPPPPWLPPRFHERGSGLDEPVRRFDGRQIDSGELRHHFPIALDQFRSAPSRGRLRMRGPSQCFLVETLFRAGPQIAVVVHLVFPFGVSGRRTSRARPRKAAGPDWRGRGIRRSGRTAPGRYRPRPAPPW